MRNFGTFILGNFGHFYGGILDIFMGNFGHFYGKCRPFIWVILDIFMGNIGHLYV